MTLQEEIEKVNTVYDLMLETACKLARKRIALRFKHNEGFKGLCRTDSSGITTIDIEPELQFYNDQELLRVFLHEISHAKNHKFTPLDFEVSDRMEAIEDKVYNMREAEADSECSTWLKYAEENRNISQPYFEGCLWSLYNSSF